MLKINLCIKDIIIEPDSGYKLKDIFLKLLNKSGYLNTLERYKFTFIFDQTDFDFSHIEKDFHFSGASIQHYNEENNIEKGKIECVILFLFPIEEIHIGIKSKLSEESITINGNKPGKLNIKKKFAPLITFNNMMLTIIISIITLLLPILLEKGISMLGKILETLNTNSGAITTIVTIVLVIITAYYARIMYFTLIEMKKNRREMEKNRTIESVGNSFEKLYYPLQDVLKKSIVQFESISKEIHKIGNNKRMLEADLEQEENKDVFIAWQTIIRNYYYFRKDYDKIIRFSYLVHSENLENELQELIEDPGGNEILRLVEVLFENWINLDTAKINDIRKSIGVDSFLAKMIDNNDNHRPRLAVMISEDIERLKSERNELIV